MRRGRKKIKQIAYNAGRLNDSCKIALGRALALQFRLSRMLYCRFFLLFLCGG